MEAPLAEAERRPLFSFVTHESAGGKDFHRKTARVE